MQAILQAVIPRSFQSYLRPVYQEVKAHVNRFDRLVDRRTISEDDFHDLICRLGIVPGATVFLHSSMDEVTRRVPQLNAAKLIGVLQNALGKDGTLAIPTFPFRGKQYDYVRQHPQFDAARTPSQVGLVTEVDRKSTRLNSSH